ncbi:MAG: alpha/beta hydrolase, partial [Methyloligellaceae bacterium]
MTSSKPQFLAVGGADGPQRRIATLEAGMEHDRPCLVWLSGLRSEMASTKATAVAEWAAENAFPVLRFDYSGHGLSDGAFEDGAIGHWLEEAMAV